MAKKHLPLHIATKQSSRGLCFVEPSERRFSDFLATYLNHPKTASVYLEDGTKVGETYAIWHVTVGERSRLNFKQSQKLNPGGKWYVASKRLDPPSYTIVAGKEHPKMYSGALTAKNWTWIDEEEYPARGAVVQIRHRQAPLKCRIEDVGEGRVRVQFTHEKAWGVAQGQAVAVWHHGRCLGGGTIEFVEAGKPSTALERVKYDDDYFE
jgi:tRNA-uridine 2-sulfurtransferase